MLFVWGRKGAVASCTSQWSPLSADQGSMCHVMMWLWWCHSLMLYAMPCTARVLLSYLDKAHCATGVYCTHSFDLSMCHVGCGAWQSDRQGGWRWSGQGRQWVGWLHERPVSGSRRAGQAWQCTGLHPRCSEEGAWHGAARCNSQGEAGRSDGKMNGHGERMRKEEREEGGGIRVERKRSEEL